MAVDRLWRLIFVRRRLPVAQCGDGVRAEAHLPGVDVTVVEPVTDSLAQLAVLVGAELYGRALLARRGATVCEPVLALIQI